MTLPRSLAALAVPLDIEPMEARFVEHLPDDQDWQFEPKWDGFRCLAFRAGTEVDLKAKSGKKLARYFPEVTAALATLPQSCFVLDGELAIASGDTFSFDALLQRIHPAARRIAKLSAETPAFLILFDMLLDARGNSLVEAPLTTRRAALEQFFAATGEQPLLKLSPYTLKVKEARDWLHHGGAALDGVVAKRRDGLYVPGERAMLKVKQIRSADCVVGGFRYRAGTREVGSLLLGLYDESGKLDHVGFTATITNKEGPALTKQLEALSAPPGFTGKAPGGKSRWSTERSESWEPVKPEFVVEVAYDQVTGDRLRHGTKLVRFRPDKAPHQCTFEQIAQARVPLKLVRRMVKS